MFVVYAKLAHIPSGLGEVLNKCPSWSTEKNTTVSIVLQVLKMESTERVSVCTRTHVYVVSALGSTNYRLHDDETSVKTAEGATESNSSK